MSANFDKLTELNNASLNKAVRLSNVALAGIERLVALQLDLTKNLLSESAEKARAFAQVKDVQGLIALQKSAAQPSLDKALGVAKSFYEVAATTQAEITKLVEEEVSSAKQNVSDIIDSLHKYAPAGTGQAFDAVKSAFGAANAAYDSAAQAAKKVGADLAQAGVKAAETSAKAVATAAVRTKKAATEA